MNNIEIVDLDEPQSKSRKRLAISIEDYISENPKSLKDKLEYDEFNTRQLQPHQQEGVEFLLKNLASKSGTILAHSMGLGKTLQIIAALCKLRPRTVVILCPPILLSGWSDEWSKWAGNSYNVYFGGGAPYVLGSGTWDRIERERLVRMWDKTGGVLLLGHHMLRQIYKSEDGQTWQLIRGCKVVICDEAHLIKRFDSQLFKAISSFNTTSRIAISATPIQNNLMEYFWMIEWVSSGLLGPVKYFKLKFIKPIREGTWLNSTLGEQRLAEVRLALLIRSLEGVVHYRGGDILRNQLPRLYQFTINILPTREQVDYYNEYLREVGHNNLFLDMHRLTCCCFHPKLIIEEGGLERRPFTDFSYFSVSLSYKMQLIIQLIIGAKRSGERCLIFSRSLSIIDLLHEHLELLKISVVKVDGRVTGQARKQSLSSLSKCDALLLTTATGSLGLNLISASRVIIVDSGWNPAVEHQAIGRAYRLGQTQNVIVYKLQISNSIEERVRRLGIEKRALSRRVLERFNVKRLMSRGVLGNWIQPIPFSSGKESWKVDELWPDDLQFALSGSVGAFCKVSEDLSSLDEPQINLFPELSREELGRI